MAGFGRRELELMQILWKYGDQTAQEIRKRVKDNVADPTVRTMLRILEDKGAVTHGKRGRAFVYKAKAPMKGTLKAMVKDIIDGFYDGDASELIRFMLGERIINSKTITKAKRAKKTTSKKKSTKRRSKKK